FRRGGQLGVGRVGGGLGLVPVDEGYRGVRRERFDFIVVAPRPAAALVIEPVGRMLRTRALAPLPSRYAPEFATPIAALLHEGGELGVRARRFGNPVGFDLYRVRQLLVVSSETISWR